MAQADNDALAILKRRLANGEITPEQYDDLASRVGPSTPARIISDPPPPQNSQQKETVPFLTKVGAIGGPILAIKIFTDYQSKLANCSGYSACREAETNMTGAIVMSSIFTIGAVICIAVWLHVASKNQGH